MSCPLLCCCAATNRESTAPGVARAGAAAVIPLLPLTSSPTGSNGGSRTLPSAGVTERRLNRCSITAAAAGGWCGLVPPSFHAQHKMLRLGRTPLGSCNARIVRFVGEEWCGGGVRGGCHFPTSGEGMQGGRTTHSPAPAGRLPAQDRSSCAAWAHRRARCTEVRSTCDLYQEHLAYAQRCDLVLSRRNNTQMQTRTTNTWRLGLRPACLAEECRPSDGSGSGARRARPSASS